jgi:hypothetical protein
VPNGSFDACPAAARRLARIVSVDRSPRARRLPDSSLVSFRCIVRRVLGGCPTARSYRFGVSFDACPAAARWLARSTRARRLPDGSLVSFRYFARRVPGGCPMARSFNACPTAARRLARVASVFRLMHLRWLPGCLPDSLLCPFGLAACPASCLASCPAVAGSSLRQSGSVTAPRLA